MFKLKSFFYAFTLICLAFGYVFATDHYVISGSSTIAAQTYENYEQSGYAGVFSIEESGNLTITTSGTEGAVFKNNSATGIGGAIYVEDGKLTIGSNAKFISNNSGSAGGAIYSEAFDKAPEIEIGDNVIFSSNTSGLSGGAIENGGKLKIGANAKFIGNKSLAVETGFNGGAIENSYTKDFDTGNVISGEVEIGANVTFEGNTSTNYGGAISNKSYSTVTIKDGAIFKNNSAGGGGAIYTTGVVNLIADTNDILFDGNTDENGSSAILTDDGGNGSGKVNLFASQTAKITFNDKIRSVFPTSELNINKSGTLSDAYSLEV